MQSAACPPCSPVLERQPSPSNKPSCPVVQTFYTHSLWFGTFAMGHSGFLVPLLLVFNEGHICTFFFFSEGYLSSFFSVP